MMATTSGPNSRSNSPYVLHLAADFRKPGYFAMLSCSPGGVEALESLLVLSPARRVLVLAGTAAAGHGALHVPRDDVAQPLSHLRVLGRGAPRAPCDTGRATLARSPLKSTSSASR